MPARALHSPSAWLSLLLVGAVAVLRDDAAISPPRTAPPIELSATAARAALEPGPARTLTARPPKLGDGPRPPTHPDDAGRFYLEQRLPLGAHELPRERLWHELQLIREREAANARARGGPGPGGIQGWESLGPGNIGGRTRALSIDPRNDQVMLAAGVSGGIFRSSDGGASWNPVDDTLVNLAVCTIARDPVNPDVLYAGTGEGFYEEFFLGGLGIFKSTDAGLSWTLLPATTTAIAGTAFHWVNEIVLSPNDPERVYAATRHGVFRSTDAGASWDVMLANPWFDTTPPTSNGCGMGCLDVAVRPDRNPDVLFAAFGTLQKDGLYRSDDGGDTWVEYVTPSWQGRMEIAIAPTNGDRIYVGVSDNGNLHALGRIADLWRSDNGINFASVLDFDHKFGPWLFSYASIATGCLTGYPIYSQGWYDQALAVDPTDEDVLFLGGIDLYRSENAGVTFGLINYWFFRDEVPPNPTYVHADEHEIVFHPDYDGVANQTMFIGNDGGLFKTNNARAASSQEECPMGENPGPPMDVAWEDLNHGYAVTQYYHGDVAQDRDRFAGGAQDNGTSVVSAANTPDAWTRVLGGDGGYVAIDPTNGDRIFASYQGFPNIWQSTDGGSTFALSVNGITDTDGLFLTPYAMDPSNPLVLWTGGQRPWRTTNGGASWQSGGPNLPNPARISAVAIAPSDGNVVYLGFENGYVTRSLNALGGFPTWSSRSAGLPLGAYVSSVAVHPTDPNIVYVTYSTMGVPHIHRSANGGGAWSAIDGIAQEGVPDIPVHCLAIRPDDPTTLYAGTEFGVFASENEGAAWAPSNAGAAHTVVEWLVSQGDDRLVAFTFGRGAFRTDLGSATAAPLTPPRREPLSIRAAPNPFRAAVALTFDLPVRSYATLAIYDVTGRLVDVVWEGERPAGTVDETWHGLDRNGRAVAAGTYFVRLEAAGATATKTIVLTN